MGSPQEHIKTSCLHMATGETERLPCPWCAGGTTGENTLSVTRTVAGLLYHCKRASCDKGGIVGSVGNSLPAEKRIQKIRAYEGAIVPLPYEVYEKLFAKYGIAQITCAVEGIKYCPDIDRAYMPVYNSSGWQIGEVLRATSGQQPKTLHNKYSADAPFLHFPIRAKTAEVLVLVEDQTSAIKVSGVVPCAALLGTNLTEAAMLQIRGLVREVVLFLDGDSAGALATTRLTKALLPYLRVRVARPPKGLDPKDMSIQEIREALL